MRIAEHFERIKDNQGNNIDCNKEIGEIGISDNVIFKSWEEAETLIENVVPTPVSYEMPADLFIAGTIPILNAQITVHNFFENNATVSDNLIFRVLIYDNYREIMEKAYKNNKTNISVGVVVLKIAAVDWIVCPLIMDLKENIVYIYTSYAYYSETKETKRYIDMPDEQMKAFSDIIDNAVFNLWYAVQIALLHPVIKTVFVSKGVDVSTNNKRKNKKNRKQVVKYIKKHIVNLEILSNLKANKHFNRKTFAWYVIGHYREYKDGKRVFINPYWKGEMRELKKSVDQRERKIITEGINND